MITVNAFRSRHSSVNLTTFGNDALTFAGEGSGALLSAIGNRSSRSAAGILRSNSLLGAAI